MSIRRITASIAALAVAVIVPIAVATPAQAGVNPHVITLQKDVNGTCVPSAASIIGNPGSVFSVHNVNCGRSGFVDVGPIRDSPRPVVEGNTYIGSDKYATFTLTSTSGPLSVIVPGAQSSPSTYLRIAVTITDTPIEDPKPHDYFQQVGVPESGDCADVDPTVGHWFGYPIGGWSQSWAQWINDGTGGAVCTREIEERLDGTVVLVP